MTVKNSSGTQDGILEEERIPGDDTQSWLSLQKQLIAARKKERLTQTEVANVAGISQQAVSRIEKGPGVTVGSLLKYLDSIGYRIVVQRR